MARRRVLLIDRDAPYREALANVLSSEGLDVQVVEVDEASDRIAGFVGDFVLCGAKCLQGNRTLAERIRGVGRRAILMGGEGTGAALGDTLEALSLPKPVNMEDLRRVLRDG